ncbi:MAG: hypothetical protein ACHQ4F_15335 [Candidatus Dormibacteria bacterium]
MEDEEIRGLLHATYKGDGLDPTVVHGALEQHPRGPRRRLTTTLVAAAAAIVVAVPISAGVLLRAGVIGDSSQPTMSVLDLKMFSATDGWAWSGGNDILHTTSGVQHWTVVPPPIGPKAIVEVAWVNAESARILATSTGALNNVEQNYSLTAWMTDDGGATWTDGQPFTVLLETGQDPMTQSNLDFVDPLHGWFFDAQDGAVGAPMLIFRTVDGGIRWSQVEMTPATGTAPRGALPVGCGAYGITFLNTSTGWVAGQCSGLATLFDVTHDGGATWAPQAIDCIQCLFYPPQFTSSRDGQMFGENGVGILFVTSDGGRTWTRRAEPTGNTPDFADASHGFTLGLTGNDNPSTVLWLTADGGATWSQATNGAIHGDGPAETAQLDFITPRIGWAVSVWFGNRGLLTNGQTPYPTPPPTLWQTTEAGSTWTLVTPTFTTSR